MNRLKQPTLQEVLRYRKIDKYDDWRERQTAMRAFKQILGKKFRPFTENQPCVDIASEDGNVSVEVELNQRWTGQNYPYRFMRKIGRAHV